MVSGLSQKMKLPKCKVFGPSERYGEKVVRSVQYDGKTLVIDIQGDGFAFARIYFTNPVGFRVLDELDLTEFWPEYSETNGWLYEVEEGGWLELENTRGVTVGSKPESILLSASMMPNLREYFIVDDKCISVLTVNPPEIRQLGTDPKPRVIKDT